MTLPQRMPTNLIDLRLCLTLFLLHGQVHVSQRCSKLSSIVFDCRSATALHPHGRWPFAALTSLMRRLLKVSEPVICSDHWASCSVQGQLGSVSSTCCRHSLEVLPLAARPVGTWRQAMLQICPQL